MGTLPSSVVGMTAVSKASAAANAKSRPESVRRLTWRRKPINPAMPDPTQSCVHSVRMSEPYLSHFTGPMPGTLTSAAASRGLVSAITVKVASVKTQ